MRVQLVGGLWRGRVLTAPKGPSIRPTSQKVRKAIFDWLGPRVQGAAVLDLFAGTGALGLEAVSGGAASAVLVDRDPACVEALRRTVTALTPLPPVTVEILAHEAVVAVRRLAAAGRRFDLIFADPPYEGPAGRKALQAVSDHVILAPSGVLIFEHAQRTPPAPWVGREAPAGRPRLVQCRGVHYGDTGVACYQWDTDGLEHCNLSRDV